jgi:arabinoxylan arabinofuranohydrolase
MTNKNLHTLLYYLFINVCILSLTTLQADNPFVKHVRTADPSAHVWPDGKVWVYTSHDQDSAINYGSMDGYRVFSSSDMVNWTDHGEILHSRDVSWTTPGNMFAPSAAYKDGMYYFYFPTMDRFTWKWRVGVATSSKPEGPFTDIGHYIEGTDSFDPCAFVDDDGTAYLYWGGGSQGGDAIPKVAKLKDNMIELAEEPRIVDYGASQLDTSDMFGEGAYMYKRNGIYYFSYNGRGGKYAMGDNPYGPFTFKGVVNANRNTGAQDHHSIIEYHNKWYFFYHVGNYEGGTLFRRNVSVDYLYHNDDGTMQTVQLTKQGVEPVNLLTKTDTLPSRIEAENYSNAYGVRTESTQDIGGGQNIGYIDNGDWLEYSIYSQSSSLYNLTFRYATATEGATVAILLNGVSQSTITMDGSLSNGWQDWQDHSTNIQIPAGSHTLRLQFSGGTGGLVNLNWMDFTENTTSILHTNNSFHIEKIRLFDVMGRQVKSISPH